MITRGSIFLCALVFFGTAIPALAAEDDPEVFIYSMGLDEQTQLVWAIKHSRLMAIPVWHEGAEEAPLSPHKAIAAATEYVRSLRVPAVSVQRITVVRVGESRDNRWIYEVEFGTDPTLPSDDPRLNVAVAMDGKVIVPEKRPEKQP